MGAALFIAGVALFVKCSLGASPIRGSRESTDRSRESTDKRRASVESRASRASVESRASTARSELWSGGSSDSESRWQ